MDGKFTRRSAIGSVLGAIAIAAMQSARAQAKPKLRFSSAFTESDLRTEAYKAFSSAMAADFDFEPYYGNVLFKQGTELVALQRENLELCNLAPADISKQIPAWSLMTSAYLFRNYDHLRKTWQSDVGQEFIKMARDQLGIELIRPVYFGARQVNLKPPKKISTPADLAGIKLRMPPGEFWQFLGESLGASPTPVAYAELYTALQSGAVDGQDNPLVAGRSMKFYEVTSQFVLTNHVLGYDMLAVSKKTWANLKPEQQTRLRAEADKAFDASAAKYIAQEQEAIEFFKKEGKQVYEPDQNAFRSFAQKRYIEKYGKDWPKGALERINAIA
ncbi:sialic acid-binding periplasmic protein SiaP precursor [Variibacter gotjawalensis]|uniref:Sialic acid-binding periplasmic protein SiaP n=1 Tax=Variibacter gotjawalensis TaxID=1333996 RepID=A0A0S3PRM8_9BRAD|nr:TRAP transporter substrate-binding protein DctP [Variibacter gotjawalensis]NIK48919.1 TRAP-type C4-dicarboxylate transport system substrate-binding protein [Variibacter gotjawalensis]RZS50775.1 TRAP-type C4-dicarboxylate transport system substrate-binding protein [Variibacter gotjawalensis]BAT58609.1 sialic acid-binding periplasmic protein SiaP precursor [Variibacter gotjawalensis]